MNNLHAAQGWVHKGASEPKTATWYRGNKLYAAQIRWHAWYNEFTKKETKTMETMMGRIFRLDRNKYLPDGSSNPNWFKAGRPNEA